MHHDVHENWCDSKSRQLDALSSVCWDTLEVEAAGHAVVGILSKRGGVVLNAEAPDPHLQFQRELLKNVKVGEVIALISSCGQPKVMLGVVRHFVGFFGGQ